MQLWNIRLLWNPNTKERVNWSLSRLTEKSITVIFAPQFINTIVTHVKTMIYTMFMVNGTLVSSVAKQIHKTECSW